MPPERNARPRNRILARLPDDEYRRLQDDLELVTLSLGEILHRRGEPISHVYFPETALVSLLTDTAEGMGIEVGVVGYDGVVGIPVVLGVDVASRYATVQHPGRVARITPAALRATFARGGALQPLLLRYTHALMSQISQTAACNRLHSLDSRLARWLLMIHDRLGEDTIQLTHQFLANMLGVRRSGVTVAAGALEAEGLIRNTRGGIAVLDRRGLEDRSCECYAVLAEEVERVFASHPKA
jgi:CRP-like cAMP-binding protein